MPSKILHRAGKAILDFGTEGLSQARARQIQACTIGAIVVAGSGPSFAALSMHHGIPLWSLHVLSNWGLNVAVLLPFLILILLGFRDAARIAYALGVNISVFVFAWLSSFDGGLYFYVFALGLVPFFVFGFDEWRRLSFFVVLPVIAVVIESIYFDSPLPGFEISPEMMQQLWAMNLINSFLITVFVIAFLVWMLRSGELRMERFSGAVSEYLDSALVDRLRSADDVSPRVRPITVFFSDLIGSTRISFSMTKEAFGRMLNEYVREMQLIIKSRGGYIEDISGDGIFGYIGNFESHGREKDAIAVVTMCIEMRQRLTDLNHRFRELYGLDRDLDVRIGISSGEATVGRTEGARAIYTANGDVVNLGAKLERKISEIKPDGGILISGTTAGLVQGRFDLSRHELEIEGIGMDVFFVESRRVPA